MIRSHIQVRRKWAVVYVSKVLLRAGILFLVSADSLQLIFHVGTSFLFLSQSHQKRT